MQQKRLQPPWLSHHLVLCTLCILLSICQALQADQPVKMTVDNDTVVVTAGNETLATFARFHKTKKQKNSTLLQKRLQGNLTRHDFVVAIPVDNKHWDVVKAGRLWRQNMRTLIANDVKPNKTVVEAGRKHNETWTWYPDDDPLRSLYAGDSRAALVPFIAHEAFENTYKWLLYGDDDTIFFMDSLMEMLKDFDHNMPYFITDHLWWQRHRKRAFHPANIAPRCLPCHLKNATHFNQSAAPFPAPYGCPCTPQLLCATDTRNIFDAECNMPRVPQTTYSMHGGAGAVISVGLLRKIKLRWMEGCVQSLTSTGGDAFISICLWRAGYAFTDPGPGFFDPHIQMFDPGPEDVLGTMDRMARYLIGKCDQVCQKQLDSMVTLHIRSRKFGVYQDAAHFMRALMDLHKEYRLKRFEHMLYPKRNLDMTALEAKMRENELENYHKLVRLGLLIPGWDDGLYE